MIEINNETEKVPWLVVTGLDGTGKTMLVTSLVRLFEEDGQRVKRTRSPHDPYLVKTLLNESGNGSPTADSYTDRAIFMLDNRILGTRIKKWRESGEYDLIISQRGFLDAFVHGSVVNFSYEQTAEFNRIWELPKCQLMIHLVANAETAYERIKNDPEGDKFETLDYMKIQEYETRKAYEMIKRKEHSGALSSFFDCINILIDTTDLSPEETFELAKNKIKSYIKLSK